MNQVLSILISYILPCGAGLGLVALGFLGKYPTEVKYVYHSLLTWFYFLVTIGGSLLFTIVLKVIGVRVVGIDWVNSIILGIIGPAVFLGVISRLPPHYVLLGTGIDQQLKTLRDYAFDTLGQSISRKIAQIVALKIKDVGRDIDLNSFLREVTDMLNDNYVPLKPKQKTDLKVQFDQWAMSGDYTSIIRELKKYYDVDYIIMRLSPDYQRKRMRTRLDALMRIAVDPHRPRDGVLPPEWVFAKVQALQKKPDDTLYYLERALKIEPSLKSQILTDEVDWWILTSMTPGEKQQAKLEALLRLIGIEHLSLEDIEQQCKDQDRLPITFMAVKKSDGDCVKITLSRRSIQDNQADSVRWWIMSEWDMHLNKECADFNEVKSHIRQVIIPIRQV